LTDPSAKPDEVIQKSPSKVEISQNQDVNHVSEQTNEFALRIDEL
jgi:hypothetical protein